MVPCGSSAAVKLLLFRADGLAGCRDARLDRELQTYPANPICGPSMFRAILPNAIDVPQARRTYELTAQELCGCVFVSVFCLRYPPDHARIEKCPGSGVSNARDT